MSDSFLNPRRYSPLVLISVSIVALILFAMSYFVEARIIIDSPNYGDVTSLLQVLWRILLGLTTIGSFLIAIYKQISDSNSSSGPATGFSIEGRNHDIDFHLHITDLDESEPEQDHIDTRDNHEPSTTSREDTTSDEAEELSDN